MTNFCPIFQPVESKLLSNYFMCRSHTLWMQNNQGKCSLFEQVIICRVRTGLEKPGKSQNLRIVFSKPGK